MLTRHIKNSPAMTHFIGRGGKCYACLDFYSTYYYNRNVFEALNPFQKIQHHFSNRLSASSFHILNYYYAVDSSLIVLIADMRFYRIFTTIILPIWCLIYTYLIICNYSLHNIYVCKCGI